MNAYDTLINLVADSDLELVKQNEKVLKELKILEIDQHIDYAHITFTNSDLMFGFKMRPNGK